MIRILRIWPQTLLPSPHAPRCVGPRAIGGRRGLCARDQGSAAGPKWRGGRSPGDGPPSGGGCPPWRAARSRARFAGQCHGWRLPTPCCRAQPVWCRGLQTGGGRNGAGSPWSVGPRGGACSARGVWRSPPGIHFMRDLNSFHRRPDLLSEWPVFP